MWKAVAPDPLVEVLLGPVGRGDHVDNGIVAAVPHLPFGQTEVVHGGSPGARLHVSLEVEESAVNQHDNLRAGVGKLGDLVEAVLKRGLKAHECL